MLSSLFDTLGALLRPLAIGLLLLVGLALMSGDGSAFGTGGTRCSSLTTDARLNRTLCKLNPARIWNTKLSDLGRAFQAQ